jgi:hypothetical protein
MPHFTLVLLLVGLFVFVLGMFMDARVHLKNRSQEMAPFRRYFGAEYDRDLLRQSSWSDGESPSEPQTRVEATNMGDRCAIERRPEGSGAIRRNRDWD